VNDADELVRQLPKLKSGFRIAGFLFAAEFVWGVLAGIRGATSPQAGYAAALTFVADLIGVSYVLHCISTYHRIVGQVDGWTHPISPKRAVRFHFIPIFNLYWNFKWIREIAKFVNWRLQRPRMAAWFAGIIVLVGYLLGALLDSSVGLVVVLAGFAYISRCLREALAAPPAPHEIHVTNRLDASILAVEN
jgi:hypothetical protein